MAGLEPKFILERPGINSKTYIMVAIRHEYRRIKISTGNKINPLYWDSGAQRPTSDRKTLRNVSPLLFKELKYISIKLDEIEYFIKDLILDLKREKSVSLGTIKDKLTEFLGRKKEIQEIKEDIIKYYDRVIRRMADGSLLTDKNTPYTPGTIRMHNVCRNQLASFKEIHNDFTFDDVNNDFYRGFLSFCNDRKYKQNTIGRTIKSLKFIMRLAYKDGLHGNLFFKDDDFRAVMVDVDNIYLTVDELKRLYDLDLSGNNRQERARDLFLIGCYTAQRFSDYSRYTPDHIKTTANGTKVIDIVTKKTKQRVIIPFLFPELDILLKKYDYYSPKIYEQDLNEEIKKIGEKAGITENVIIAEKIDGKMVETIFKKNELIKTHTARRSGATNLFKMGYAPLEIMKITGHTSEATFMKYIKVSKEENAERMMSKRIDV